MTAKETKQYISDFKKFAANATKSPDTSKDLLVKAGICTKNGNLRKPYK
jgi:hypothetical protein